MFDLDEVDAHVLRSPFDENRVFQEPCLSKQQSNAFPVENGSVAALSCSQTVDEFYDMFVFSDVKDL
jgi:hypothetical protein